MSTAVTITDWGRKGSLTLTERGKKRSQGDRGLGSRIIKYQTGATTPKRKVK